MDKLKFLTGVVVLVLKKKKIPQRMCVGCREKKDKRELIRVVRSPEGNVDVDPSGKKPGRGAYICPQETCFLKAKKSKNLDKALQIKLPDELLEVLIKQVENYIE